MPGSSWSLQSLNKLITNIDKTGSVDRKSGSGRKLKKWIVQNVDTVEELVLSQESAPGTYKTIRQISQETGISKTSVHRVVKRDLKLQCSRKRKAQDLTAANKFARLFQAKQLLRKYPEHAIPFMWFSDEKVFTVAPPMNLLNDRRYVASGTRKKHVPAERLVKKRSNFSRSVIVSLAVSSLGSTELVFVEPSTKVDGTYYRDVLLTQHLLPAIKWMSYSSSSSAHQAQETIALLSWETPDFIPPWLWPLNSPDLNPVDYHVWSILEQRVYRTRIRDISHLKTRLVEEWHKWISWTVTDRQTVWCRKTTRQSWTPVTSTVNSLSATNTGLLMTWHNKIGYGRGHHICLYSTLSDWQ